MKSVCVVMLLSPQNKKNHFKVIQCGMLGWIKMIKEWSAGNRKSFHRFCKWRNFLSLGILYRTPHPHYYILCILVLSAQTLNSTEFNMLILLSETINTYILWNIKFKIPNSFSIFVDFQLLRLQNSSENFEKCSICKCVCNYHVP